MKNITVKNDSFFDANGKEIILRGINIVCKDKSTNYLGNISEQDFEELKKYGFNVVRFGIFWDAVEPKPGQYDNSYLDKIKEIARLAKRHGICLYLDMHQDLFSSEFCDGAPKWATMTDGFDYTPTQLWSEAYLTCPAVQVAFDNFWNNTKASDNVGIQMHYINMWEYIAKYFKDESNIIGYDCLNEPFPGTMANALIQNLFNQIGTHLAVKGQFKVEDINEELIMSIWLDDNKKAALLADFSKKEDYKDFIMALSDSLKDFDINLLTPFYQKLRDAIRNVDDSCLLFIEANYFCNTGIKSFVIPPKDSFGNVDSHIVYAPHGYDLMVDTDMYSSDCFARLDVIFEAHKDYAKAYNIPVLIGEWGCYPNANEAQIKEASYLLGKFEANSFSNTYYDYSTFIGNPIRKAFTTYSNSNFCK